jgi:Ca2+-transporting ATPase
MAALLLLGHGVLVGQGVSETESRLAVFTGLVLGVFLLVLSNRDLSRPAIMGLAANNPWIKRMFGVVALLLIVVMTVPFLRGVMGFAPAGMHQLIASLLLLVGVSLWLETLRRLGGRLLFEK